MSPATSHEALDATVAALKAVGVEIWPGHGFLFLKGVTRAAEDALIALSPDEVDAIIDHRRVPSAERVPA